MFSTIRIKAPKKMTAITVRTESNSAYTSPREGQAQILGPADKKAYAQFQKFKLWPKRRAASSASSNKINNLKLVNSNPDEKLHMAGATQVVATMTKSTPSLSNKWTEESLLRGHYC